METAVENGASLVFSVGGTYYYDEDQVPQMLNVLAGFEEAAVQNFRLGWMR